MRRTTLACCVAVGAAMAAGSASAFDGPSFPQMLNNMRPLTFGMSADAAADALGAPLNYIGGRPGDETFLVIRTHGGGGFFPRDDRLFLQFRRGRLTGLKGDWGRNWMWR